MVSNPSPRANLAGRVRRRILIVLARLLGLSHHEYTQARRALELAERLADDGLIAAAHRTLGNLLARANQLRAFEPLALAGASRWHWH